MNSTSQTIQSFDEFGLSDPILKGVREADFKIPSPIQQQVIPLILAGRDVVGQAHTGTGKTAAFGLPAMSMVKDIEGVGLLVITPTRELATQVSDELFRLGRFAGIRTVAIYGGQSYSRQIGLVKRGAQVVVATPGRLLDLLKSGKLEDFNPTVVVLDEADEMLDMGFLDDIREIFTFLPQNRQTLLFSATMPPPIANLASTILKNPQFVSVTAKEVTSVDIEQYYYVIEEHERDDAIVRLLESEDPIKSIIFCRMKKEVDRLTTMLLSRGFSAKGLHGDMEQRSREEVIKGFRSADFNILVATDVAARGLDVKDVSHVFNYHIPFDPESYVHRIGRTGRAGRQGKAVTLVTPLELKELERIRKAVGGKIKISTFATHKELKTVKLEKILEEIRHQPLDENATAILRALEEEMDLAQIASKLISIVLSKQAVSGPEKIGFDEKKVEKMLEAARAKEGREKFQKRGPREFQKSKKGSFREKKF